MSTKALSIVLCSSFTLAASLSAGMVVNLGPTSALINISATQDGAGAYNLGQTIWWQPFNVNGNLLEYTVQAGTYNFALVNNDPNSAYYNPNAAFEAWTYNAPWITDYLVFDSSAATDKSEPQLLFLAKSAVLSANASSAFNLAVTGGYRTASYTFAAPETLIFGIPDPVLGDNSGGISLLVSKSSAAVTPEPASIALILLGFGGLAVGVRRSTS